MSVAFSIIIPVYNTEKYLPECLDSVFGQNFKNFEVIAINDGSTDASPEILERYALKYKNLKIINKKNEGQGYARKVGLNIADGEYISFLDCDDILEKDALNKLYGNITKNESELAIMKVAFFDHLKKEKSLPQNHDISQFFPQNTDFAEFTFSHKDIQPFVLNGMTSCCNKIYKNKFLKNNKELFFPKNTFCEDVPFHVQTILKAKKISFCPYVLYNYRISNTDSTTHTIFKTERCLDLFTVTEKLEEILRSEGLYELYKDELLKYFLNAAQHFYANIDTKFKQKFYENSKKILKNIEPAKENLLNEHQQTTYEMFLLCDSYESYEYISQKIKKKIDEQTKYYEDSIENIKKSWSFRIGNTIIKTIYFPISLIKKIVKK